MKNFLFLLVPAMIFVGCTTDPGDVAVSQNEPAAEEIFYEPTTRGALTTALYHEGAGAWIVSQPDPFSLENFRAAQEKLLSGASEQILLSTQKSELAAAELKATHYAMRIYPKNDDEQRHYEMMEDINILYTPFDHVQLTQKEVDMMPEPQGNMYPESYRYTVTYTDLETAGEPVPDKTFILPILYAVWPVDKPMPDIEYEIDYEVFLPNHAVAEGAETTRNSGGSGLSFDTLTVLNDEAVSIALGIPVQPQTDENTRAASGFPTAYLRHWDNQFLIRQNVPVQNVKINYLLGSQIETYYTGEDGGFPTDYWADIPKGIKLMSIPDHAIVGLVFQRPGKWTITNNDITKATFMAPICTFATLKSVYSYNIEIPTDYFDIPVMEIARAVNHYYNNNERIPVEHANPICIVACTTATTPGGGSGQFVDSANPFIYIGNLNRNSTNNIIATVLHELGHWNMWEFRGGSLPNRTDSQRLISESWASYSGWVLTEEYYGSLGWVKSSPAAQISQEGRQGWIETWTDRNTPLYVYSPLFVDLVDNYNQISLDPNRPNDNLENFPYSKVVSIAKNGTSWGAIKTQLQQSVGIHCTQAELNAYTISYDYWLSNNF